jgi:hypothetical protein
VEYAPSVIAAARAVLTHDARPRYSMNVPALARVTVNALE